MMAGAHIDEEILVSVAELGADQDTYPHLDECDDCRASVEQYRAVVLSLADESTWDLHALDETPNPQTIANLRAYVDQMQREDAEAEPLVAELLAGSREEWMPRLMADEKYRTAGVVRKLIAATDRAAEESPKDYVEIAKLAVEVSDGLTTAANGGDDVLRLRGGAYRERSYSLYLVGEIDAAMEWGTLAATTLELCRSAAHDLGRVHILLSTINWRLERLTEAERRCEQAEEFFSAAGDIRKQAHASILRATVMAQRNDFRGALIVTSSVIKEFDDVLDDYSRAAIRCNQGFYLRETGEIVAAIEKFQEAGFILTALGATASLARVEFNEAILLQRVGDHVNASDRLVRVIRDFENLGMRSTATLAALYLAESRLAEGRFDEVDRLCSYAMDQVRSSPDAYRERALVALGLLREASMQRRISPRLVHRVRRYVERVPSPQSELYLGPYPSPS
jgi:tetratricopeptide (TPR) repeat protein